MNLSSMKWCVLAAATILLIGCASPANLQARDNPADSGKTAAASENTQSREDNEKLFNKDNEFLLRALARNIKKDPTQITRKDLQDVRFFFIYDAIKNNLKESGFDLNEAYDFSLIQDMPNLESLQIDGIRLKDYSVLKKAPKLASLGISCLDDNSARTIGEITSLAGIAISDSIITNIDFLSNCKDLWYVSIRNTSGIRNFDVLESLGQLKYLELYGLRLDSMGLAGLPEMERLETLKVSGNNIDSVSSLSSMPSLLELYLDQNPIQSVSIPVDKVPRLSFLSIQNALVDNINKIKGLDNLYELDIRGSRIKYVAPLKDMKKTGRLKNLQSIYLTKKDIKDWNTLKGTGIGVLEIKLG